MPVYEFQCAKCRHKTSVFVRGFTVSETPVCGRCGSADTKRVFSTFALHRSSSEGLSEDAMDNIDESDPRAMARMMRAMKSEMGDEEAGPEFDDIVDRMEAGEDVGLDDELGGGGMGMGGGDDFGGDGLDE